MVEADLSVADDFDYLVRLLPAGWEEQAKALGALRRCRKIPDARALLRVLLIHLAEGCSLRETAVRASQGGVAEVSDVAIMDRLRQSAEWFRWMSSELMKTWDIRPPADVYGPSRRVRIVDGTRVKEPGPTGSSWCIHYSIGLPSLRCEELSVHDVHGNGETFARFSVSPGDLFLGDRVYGVRPGIFHVVRGGGDVLVRFAMSNLPLNTPTGCGFDLLRHLRKLRGTRIGDWPVCIQWESETIEGRVCALKKSRQATERAQQQLRRESQKSGSKPRPETLEAAGYLFVFTTVCQKVLCATKVLEMYRGRWQIELVFKRLKSILALGHLRKTDPQAGLAWIEGKLFVAFLVESLIRYAETFFPWGYPLCETPATESMPLA
jgi:hypothetical protein